jgi:molybdopterin-binding protein
MQAGVRNKVAGEIEEIRSDEIMAEVKMRGKGNDNTMRFTSVMTRESLDDAGFKKGDRVEALVKAINVVFVKQ